MSGDDHTPFEGEQSLAEENDFASGPLDLELFRRGREEQDELSRGRRPLYLSHTPLSLDNGQTSSRLDDFSVKVLKLRRRIGNVSDLLADLKRFPSEEDHGQDNRGPQT